MKIIYQNADNSIGIIIPADPDLTEPELIELGIKDTPDTLPFWVVEDSEIPADRTMRDAWTLDGTQGEPDGHGGVEE